MKEINKTISVIIPCYNSQLTLAECLMSFIGQDIQLKEIIVVDDCSKDTTVAIAEKIAAEAKIPIILIKNEKNLGQGASRNVGAWRAKGDYIVQSEADAKVSRNYCRNLVEAIIKNPKTISFGGLRICWALTNNIWKRFWDAYFVARWKLLKEKKVPKLGGWAFKKEDFMKFGGYNSLRQGEDIDLVNRMKNAGFENLWVPNVIFEHFEPQTFVNVFKRFSRSKEKIKLLKQNVQLLKAFLASLIYMLLVFTGILIGFAPVLIYFVPEGRKAIGYLVFKKKDWLSAFIFPWLYFFFKFSSAFGIFIGTILYILKVVLRSLRSLQSSIFFDFKEEHFRKVSLDKSLNKTLVPILISMDDFCPALGGPENEWEKLSDGSWINKNLIKLLDKGFKVTLFTTPAMFDGNKYWNINEFPAWLKLIKDYGDKIEIACHGLNHYNFESKTKMKEFDSTDYSETKNKINKALEMFKAAGFTIRGIRPPGWGVGKGGCLIDVSKELGLMYGSFASINDGMNRYFKQLSNFYPIKYRGIINIPQNIGINEINAAKLIKKVICSDGLVSVKLHYGNYSLDSKYAMSDNLDSGSLQRFENVMQACQETINKIGKKSSYQTYFEYLGGY